MTTENWDSYFCRVEGKSASILVDLGRIADAPRSDRPFLGRLRLALRSPDENGFPAQEEYDRLAEIEDSLEEDLRKSLSALYVGRCATGGCFELFFYLPEGANWRSGLEKSLPIFGEYAWEAESYPDPEWETYGQFLFPDAYALLGIQNARIRRQLLEQGDDPGKSRRVEHWAAFPDAGTAKAFALAAAQQGFHLEEVQEEGMGDADPESRSGEAGQSLPPGATPGGAVLFHACVSRPDAPDEIDEATFSLTDLALEHGGVYQGWACPIVT